MFGDAAKNAIKPKTLNEASFSENLNSLNEITNQDKLFAAIADDNMVQFANDNPREFSDSTNDFMISMNAIDTDVYANEAIKAPKNGEAASFTENLRAFNTNQEKLDSIGMGNQALVQFANHDPQTYSDE